METNIDALWKTFELSRNDNTSKSSSVFYFSYDMIEKTIRLIIFVGRNELLEKQIKAKRCKWHSCQIITSKSVSLSLIKKGFDSLIIFADACAFVDCF